MLIGGADVSGGEADGQHNHAALVIGKEDAINRIYNRIGISPIHMSEISKSQRRQVRDSLDFSSNELIVWCFHVSRQIIESDMKERIAPRKKRNPSINVHKSFESYIGFRRSGKILNLSRARSGWSSSPILSSRRMPICVRPSKTGTSASGSGEGRTSWRTRWHGSTKKASRYRTASSGTCVET